MTRNEAKELISFCKKQDTAIKLIDKIFDDFENRSCDGCCLLNTENCPIDFTHHKNINKKAFYCAFWWDRKTSF